jgi:hypothetical protein
MSKDRPPITARMKVNSLLHRVYLQFGAYLKDPNGEDLKPGDPVVFDHMHGLAFKGPHQWENLRPVQKRTNIDKAKREVRDLHHLRRLITPSAKAGPSVPASRFEGSRGIGANSFENRSRR